MKEIFADDLVDSSKPPCSSGDILFVKSANEYDDIFIYQADRIELDEEESTWILIEPGGDFIDSNIDFEYGDRVFIIGNIKDYLKEIK